MDLMLQQLRRRDGAADGRHVGRGGAGREFRANGAAQPRPNDLRWSGRAVEPSEYFDEVLLGKAGEVLPGSWLADLVSE